MSLTSPEQRERVKELAKKGISYSHIRKLTGLNYRTIRRVLNAEKEIAELGINVKTKEVKPSRLPTPAEEVKMNYVRLADRVLDLAEQIMSGRKNEVRKEVQNGITERFAGRSETDNGSQTKGTGTTTTSTTN